MQQPCLLRGAEGWGRRGASGRVAAGLRFCSCFLAKMSQIGCDSLLARPRPGLAGPHCLRTGCR